MPKHAKPILVGFWPGGYQGTDEAGSALVDDWDGRGGFTLRVDHPAAQAIWDRGHAPEFVITVLDSAELEWVVEHVTIGDDGRVAIRCTPRADRLRNLLESWARIRELAA